MKNLFLLILLVSTIGIKVNAHTPTWTDGIACIIYSHCTNCHNAKGIAPFSLMEYQEVYVNRYSISASVRSGSMPPFPASQEKVKYAHDNTLSQHEIDEIVEWVDNFAPYGNASTQITPPTYDSKYGLSNPDWVGKIPTYSVDTDVDLYRVFVIPVGNTSERYIKSVEISAGNPDIVHHVLAFQDSSNRPIQLDNADPGPGYTSFGGTGSSASTLFSGYVPGQGVAEYPPGMGFILEENTNILLQVHYPGGTYNEVDSTEIRIKFSGQPLRELFSVPLVNHGASMVNGPLFIPANTVKTFYTETDVISDVTVTALLPHMHLIGQSIRSYAITPQRDTIHLVDIPEWDFHWQGYYQFEKPVKIPIGSKIHGEATYDNTSSNYNNPNSPPRDVRLGEATTDEMLLVYFNITPYFSGDEHIIVDTTSHFPHDSSCFVISNIDIEKTAEFADFPSPFTDQLNISSSELLSQISIYDLSGKEVIRREILENKTTISTDALNSGVYILRVTKQDGTSVSKRIIKLE